MRLPNPPKQPMVTCGNCGSKNEADRQSCRNCHRQLSSLARHHTTKDLADRYQCKPRAVARMAALGRWPSLMVLGEYRFTDEMVAWIDQQHERWPQTEPAHAEALQPKPQPARKPRQRRTPQPPPPPDPGSNVRRLVAKERPNRIRRPA